MLTLQLYGAVTFLDRIQVGLNLPVVLYGDGERYEYLEGTGDGRSNRVASNGGAVGGQDFGETAAQAGGRPGDQRHPVGQ